jgi:hypothetical protein
MFMGELACLGYFGFVRYRERKQALALLSVNASTGDDQMLLNTELDEGEKKVWVL